MKAKFRVDSVTKYAGLDVLKFVAVGAKKYGAKGESEDNDFARWTPSGVLKMSVTNPDLLGKIQPGEHYYLDFIKAD